MIEKNRSIITVESYTICMNLLSRAGTYLQTENSEYDSLPDSIGVGIAEYADVADYEISGRFPEEQDEDRILPPQERVLVDRSSEMQSLITDVFGTVRESVSITGGAEITSIHISSTGDVENMPDDWSFYTSATADARVFIGVTQDYVPTDVKEELLNLVVTDVQEVDAELTTDNIKNTEFLFSDMEECLLQTVRGDIMTPRPHNHFKEVDSLDEYIDVVADTESEAVSMYEQEEYEVYYRLADAESVPEDAVREVGEGVMWDFITESLETDWEYIVEAEGIYFGDFDDGLLSEAMKYYVNIPIVGDEIGVSR